MPFACIPHILNTNPQGGWRQPAAYPYENEKRDKTAGQSPAEKALLPLCGGLSHGRSAGLGVPERSGLCFGPDARPDLPGRHQNPGAGRGLGQCVPGHFPRQSPGRPGRGRQRPGQRSGPGRKGQPHVRPHPGCAVRGGEPDHLRLTAGDAGLGGGLGHRLGKRGAGGADFAGRSGHGRLLDAGAESVSGGGAAGVSGGAGL